jgi:hypothetical protein
MNIFEIFTYGNGRHTETNLTSILAFLLDPQESHGFGTSFINEFLLPIEKDIINIINQQKIKCEDIALQLKDTHISFQIQTEQRFNLSNIKQRILDIVVTLKDQSGNDLLIIGIENKINQASAVDPNQLTDELKQLLNSTDEDTPLIFIYITPFPINIDNDVLWNNLVSYSNTLKSKNHTIQNYSWGGYFDLNESQISKSLKKITYQLLEKERNAEINPASSHSELLLRSLIRYIDSNIAPSRRINSSERDNLMEANQNSEDFWNKDWELKTKSMNYAKKCKDYINEIINIFLQKNNAEFGSNLYLINKSSRVRYSGYLSNNQFIDVEKKSNKGRVYRIRSDGGTNTKRIEILFSHSLEIIEDILISNIPIGISILKKPGEICIHFQIENIISDDVKMYLEILLNKYSIPAALNDLNGN